jgi:hypothetical protein
MRGNGSVIEKFGPATKAECRGMSANVLQSEKCTPSCSEISAVKNGDEQENPTGYAEFPVEARKI